MIYTTSFRMSSKIMSTVSSIQGIMNSIKTGMKSPVRAAGVHKGHYELTEAYVLVGGRENPCSPAGDIMSYMKAL